MTTFSKPILNFTKSTPEKKAEAGKTVEGLTGAILLGADFDKGDTDIVIVAYNNGQKIATSYFGEKCPKTAPYIIGSPDDRNGEEDQGEVDVLEECAAVNLDKIENADKISFFLTSFNLGDESGEIDPNSTLKDHGEWSAILFADEIRKSADGTVDANSYVVANVLTNEKVKLHVSHETISQNAKTLHFADLVKEGDKWKLVAVNKGLNINIQQLVLAASDSALAA